MNANHVEGDGDHVVAFILRWAATHTSMHENLPLGIPVDVNQLPTVTGMTSAHRVLGHGAYGERSPCTCRLDDFEWP